jgi:hypothetical protein
MRIRHQKLTMLGLVILMGISAFAPAVAGAPAVVGKVVRSSHATVDGGALLSNGTILSGEAVTVGEDGVVVLNYSPTGRAALTGSTSVRFTGARGNVEAQLLSGTLAVEKQNNDAFVVKTSTYKIEPRGEGRAEFVVALLPDKRATVEAQHGRVVITETRSGEAYTLLEGQAAQIPATPPAPPARPEEQHKVIGKVVSSEGATRNGKVLSGNEWVRDGDAISTGATGRAVVQLLPTNIVTIRENTYVLFTLPVDRVWLRLQNGTVMLEDKGDSNALIATTRFHVEPNSSASSTFSVAVRPDDSTAIEALVGDAKIREIPFDQAYLLPEGQKTLVAANVLGLPKLQPIPGTAAEKTTPEPPPSQPAPTPGVKGKSHTTLIIVAAAGGAGIAGAVAALSGGGGGGGGSQPVSPSAP